MKISNFKIIPKEETSHEGIFCRRFLRFGEVKHLTNFSQALIPAGEIVKKHSHEDMTEVFYILSGKGDYIVDGISHALEANTSLCIEAGEEHELHAHEDLTVLYFGIIP